MDLRAFGTVLSANRCINGEYTPEARAAIVAATVSGVSHVDVAAAFGTKRVATISDIVNNTITTNTTKTANRRRGKYKTSPRDERQLVIQAKKHPELTYAQLLIEADLSMSVNTCKAILKRHHMGNWRKAKRILLTEKDVRERYEFCRYWSQPGRIEELMRALFSDECTIENTPTKPGVWVFRFASERFRKDLVDTQGHGRARISIMVWAMVWLRDNEGGHQSWYSVKEIRMLYEEESLLRAIVTCWSKLYYHYMNQAIHLCKITLQFTLRGALQSG